MVAVFIPKADVKSENGGGVENVHFSRKRIRTSCVFISVGISTPGILIDGVERSLRKETHYQRGQGLN
jgi:hypothetical protein